MVLTTERGREVTQWVKCHENEAWEPVGACLTRIAEAGEDFPEKVPPKLNLEDHPVSQVKVWGAHRQKEQGMHGHRRQQGGVFDELQ